MPELSVIIPARNEEWLNLTVADVLSHIEADTEIIVILDGAWPKEPLTQHERVHIVYLPQAIGQRAATNLGAKISTATYICKLDAHCSIGQGFDRILIEAFTYVYTYWVCEDRRVRVSSIQVQYSRRASV